VYGNGLKQFKTVADSKNKKKRPELDATLGMARPSYGRYAGDGASFLWTLCWGWRVLHVDASLGMARPPHNN
ncbi:hypothetical protein A2U01_0056939, partial [Trifolium medium]|nr:hypothetical protein [Trifolium medium]